MDLTYFVLFAMMSSIIFASVNVNGLRDVSKQSSIISYIKRHKFEITFLQETHITDVNESNSFFRHFKGNHYHSFGTNTSRGVSILLSKNFTVNDNLTLNDDHGRILCLTVTHKLSKRDFTLINVYAPNISSDRIDFLANLKTKIPMKNNVIIGGDFNCYEDFQLDRSPPLTRKSSGYQGTVQLRDITNTFDLVDIWRNLYPNQIGHTHISPQYKVCTRIDKFFISKSFVNNVKDARIIPYPQSDHDTVTCKIFCNNSVKGPGLWHLNTSILNDDDYIEVIETFWHEWTNQKEQFDDIAVWWDVGKAKIKSLTKTYCSTKCEKEISEKKNIEKELNDLMSRQNQDDQNTINSILDAKSRLKEFEMKELEGIKIRSKIQWREEGETNSRFFCNLEQKNATTKTFDRVQTANGNIVTDINGIMKEQVNFYKKLYSCEQTDRYAQNFLLNNLTSKLDDDNQGTCETAITFTECEKAISQTNNNKSPGSDGIPNEFYKKFWYLLKNDFLHVVNFIFETGSLSDSQRKGVITLLYKKGPKELLSNWRPITLLNSDYKIISKVLANRLRSVLPQIIKEDQTCGIPGRTINSNLSLLRDIVDYCNDKDIPSAMICLDQLKAFDRVNWDFIYRTLSAMNFGPNFIKWVKILYTDITSCIKSNGFISESFKLQRGVRQGCPLSPLLYCIVSEVMAEAIRNEPKIKGIKLPDNSEIKISQYADDTTLFVSDTDSISSCLSVLRVYAAASGAKINIDKTKGLWLGTMKQNQPIFEDIEFTNTKINVLGIWIGNEDCTKDNWDPIITKLEKTLNLWSQRDLSYQGKVTVINILATSKLWYVSNVFPMPQWALVKINKAISNFLWSNKMPLINRQICHQNVESGGINLVDIKSKILTQRIIWTCKTLSEMDKVKHKNLAQFFFGKYRNTGLGLDVLKLDTKLAVPNYNNMPKFYIECLQAWKLMKPTTPNPRTKTDILKEPLFDNPKITNINRNGTKSTICIKSLVDKRIVSIKNICNGRHFATPENVAKFADPYDKKNRSRICTKYKILISCIPQEWINILRRDTNNSENAEHLFTFTNPNLNAHLTHTKATSKEVYQALIKNKQAPQCQKKWDEYFNDSLDWKLIWTTAKHKSVDKRLCDLNWKILHRAINTNSRLFRLNIIDKPDCDICKDVQEDLLHCIASCPHAFHLWLYVGEILSKFLGTTIVVDIKTIVLGFYELQNINYQIANFCLSAAKSAIWNSRNIYKFDGRTKNPKYLFKSNVIYRIKQQRTADYDAEPWSRLLTCL